MHQCGIFHFVTYKSVVLYTYADVHIWVHADMQPMGGIASTTHELHFVLGLECHAFFPSGFGIPVGASRMF